MSLEASAAGRPFYSPRGFPSRHSRIGSRAGRGARGGGRVALIATRVGMPHAARATQRAIDLYVPPPIVFSGICGGMSPTNHIGDILLQDEWGQHDFWYVGADGKITVRQGPLD